MSCRYVWGAFTEYIVCKPFNVHVVPDHFRDEDISPIEVLPGIIHAAELANITTNTDVLIMGQKSGLVMTQVVSLFSPRSLVVTDLKAANLELARKYGAPTPINYLATMRKPWPPLAKTFPMALRC